MSQDSRVAGTSRMMGLPGTHVIDHGGPVDGPLLVLLHGFGGSALNWQLVGPTLAKEFRVLAVDFYAHGRSSAPEGLNASDVVSQIEAVIEAELHGWPIPVVLVAGSFGASMAFMLARRRPDIISAVVAVDGAIPVHPHRRLDLVMTLKRWLISLPGVSALIFGKSSSMSARDYVHLQLTEAGVKRESVDPRLLEISVSLEEVRHHDRAAHDSQQSLLRDLLRIFARGRAFTHLTASVQAPVLWLHSDNDPLIPFDLAKGFVARHPGWDFRSRSGLGHVPMVVEPGWVTEETRTWLRTKAQLQ